MAKRHPKANRRQAAYQQLHTAFPLVFPLNDADLRPLALSVRDEVAAWATGQGMDAPTARQLIGALQHHCSRRTYQQVVAAGGMRINVQGEPVEPVTGAGVCAGAVGAAAGTADGGEGGSSEGGDDARQCRADRDREETAAAGSDSIKVRREERA